MEFKKYAENYFAAETTYVYPAAKDIGPEKRRFHLQAHLSFEN